MYMLRKYIGKRHDLAPTDMKSFLSKNVYKLDETEKAVVVYLDIIDQPCDSTDTLKKVLEELYQKFNIGSEVKHLVLVGDGKTYDFLVKLKYEYWNELNWLIIFQSDWHLLKNYQPVLFKVYMEAGLKALAKLNFKEEGLLGNLIECKNFKRTHEFILCVFEALYRHQLDFYFNNKPNCEIDIQEVLEIALKTFKDSDSTTHVSVESLMTKIGHLYKDYKNYLSDRQSDKTFKFWSDFLHRDCLSYVMLYIAIRTGNWQLRIAAIKMMCPLFHVYDRPLYLRLITRHLADLLVMPNSVLQHLSAGGFTVTVTGNMDRLWALDEAHESLINLDVKTHTSRPSAKCLKNITSHLTYRASYLQNLHKLTSLNRLFQRALMLPAYTKPLRK